MERFVSLCCESPADIFGLENKGYVEKGRDADLVLFTEGGIGTVNDEMLLSAAGWSPYTKRDAAPTPELVIVAGKLVAQNGTLIGENPNGKWLGEN